jgi:hypothetical protein
MKKQVRESDEEKPSPSDKDARSRAHGIRQILANMVNVLGPFLVGDSRRTRARALLFAAKLQDKQVPRDGSLIRAKLAAKMVEQTGDLDFCMHFVLLAIEANDKQFFIDFGRCLSNEIKDTTLFDKRERDIAELVACNPNMSAREAVRELENRGHRGITEENFRMWKMRLLKAKPLFDEIIARLHNKFPSAAVTDNPK